MTSQEGLPVVYPLKNFYKNLILIDVPSSDSDPLRTIADKAVRWADILAYTFTYTSYRNDINLQQLRDTFARIGQKPVILIYRAPASMPKRDADAHFKTVTQAMFPNATINPDTGLPTLIKGVYILLESDKVGAGYAIPVLKPYGKAGKKLWDVLQNYDSAPLPARRQSLQNNFTFVVNGINKDIINLQREQAERKVTDEAFQLLMKASVDRMLNMFPYDRLASALHFRFDSCACIARRSRFYGFRRRGFHLANTRWRFYTNCTRGPYRRGNHRDIVLLCLHSSAHERRSVQGPRPSTRSAHHPHQISTS